MDTAEGDHHRRHGGRLAADQRLQRHDHLRGDHDRVDCQLGLGSVTASSANRQREHVRARHHDAARHTELTCRQR